MKTKTKIEKVKRKDVCFRFHRPGTYSCRDVEWRHEILSTFQFFGGSLSLRLYFSCEQIIFPSLLISIESLFICMFAWTEVVWIDAFFGYFFRPIKRSMSPFWRIKMTNFFFGKSYVYKAVTQAIDTAFWNSLRTKNT